MCVCVGVWVCGCVGVWVCGCVGVWVCGCVSVWVWVLVHMISFNPTSVRMVHSSKKVSNSHVLKVLNMMLLLDRILV